ncbi:hypothetical protein R6Q59_031027 [Mikania micrantha]
MMQGAAAQGEKGAERSSQGRRGRARLSGGVAGSWEAGQLGVVVAGGPTGWGFLVLPRGYGFEPCQGRFKGHKGEEINLELNLGFCSFWTNGGKEICSFHGVPEHLVWMRLTSAENTVKTTYVGFKGGNDEGQGAAPPDSGVQEAATLGGVQGAEPLAWVELQQIRFVSLVANLGTIKLENSLEIVFFNVRISKIELIDHSLVHSKITTNFILVLELELNFIRSNIWVNHK